ncbi:tRNA1(Val) (adenine(37)-N6)-methyltransferase [Solitalea koreensis]|uniref:tRNA1(Val) (adenine(37)-N6)-methyltransferase n=1 Tax=Solitalea koreensis TaxID=543615 RepID=A0A521BPW7_9SPHI|nr:methyltransferase [Solitalea koreensis]SMO49212.1 tRNA1Val (adenine37-N6)-methyltransferase [Solitalea koreensis]
MSKDYFQFKQFKVYHDKCAMKVGTDGLLLGTLTNSINSKNILDIGSGTGLIALILAQRSPNALIDAVEIESDAYEQARSNFVISVWSDRLKIFHTSIFDFRPKKKYDLIVSNPPYFINSLKSNGKKKEAARHIDEQFFAKLAVKVNDLLESDGKFWLILPLIESDQFAKEALHVGLFPEIIFNVHSFDHAEAKRKIVAFGKNCKTVAENKFVIYDSPGKHSAQYRSTVKDFLTIF